MILKLSIKEYGLYFRRVEPLQWQSKRIPEGMNPMENPVVMSYKIPTLCVFMQMCIHFEMCMFKLNNCV